jgi:hypothetical protein
MEENGLFVRDEMGNVVRLADGKVLARKPMWHRLGLVKPEGFTAVDGYLMVDYDKVMSPWLMPLTLPDGTPTPFSMVVRRDATGELIQFGKPVATGAYDYNEWMALNSENMDRPRRTRRFELVTASDVVDIADQHWITPEGDPVLFESMGFLGKNGRDGFFMSTKLQSWSKEFVEASGTEADEYCHVYLDIARSKIYIYNSTIIAVCQNTVLFGLQQASTVLRVESELGALDRVAEGMGRAYGVAHQVAGLAEAEALAMLERPVTEDEAQYVINRTYRDAGTPDEALLGVTPMVDRQAAFEKRQMAVEARRAAALELFTNEAWHSVPGITPQMRGTAFGLYQVITFGETYKPTRKAGLKNYIGMAKGEGRRNQMRAFEAIKRLDNPDFEIHDFYPEEEEGEEVYA